MSVYLQQVNDEIIVPNFRATFFALPEGTPAQVAYKIEQRNRIISDFIYVYDYHYEQFVIRFYAGQAEQDIVSDFIQLGLGGAGSIAGGARVKSILATASALAAGGKSSIDNRWLNENTRYALVSEMNALRDTQLGVIQTGMLRTLQAYSLDQGIRDAQAYYMAGSVVSALQAISSTAGAEATAAKNALQKIGR
jgi:hypothetical protein